MSTFHGQFVWLELMTTDAVSATSFYTRALGWNAEDAGMSDRQYMVLSAGATMMGGLLKLPKSALDAGARPGWIGYFSADDVDATAARVTALGGTVHKPAEDIPGIGRFAIVADPQGASFVLFKPNRDGMTPPPASTTPGHVGWLELHAADREAAFAFYAELFGWTKADAMDMGPMGIYQMFATSKLPTGGMMTKSDAIPRPFWLYYVNVADIDATLARVTSLAGSIVNGPMEVPGGSRVAQCMDREGAMFAVVQPPK